MRIDYASVVPAAHTALLGLEKVVHSSDLDPKLLELVKVRASQINGCARCLEMHTDSARKLGQRRCRRGCNSGAVPPGMASSDDDPSSAWPAESQLIRPAVFVYSRSPDGVPSTTRER